MKPFTVVALAVAVVSALAAGACGSTAPSAPGPSTAQQSPPQSSSASLTGRVQGQGTGPIVGAMVAILSGPNAGKSATTGDDGVYRLDGLTPGNATLLATATNYLEARSGTFVNGTNTLDFTLTRTTLWSQSGVGPQVFVVPNSVTRVRLTADFAGSCDYFQVRFQTGWIVNTNLGDCNAHHLEGTYATHVGGGGPVQVIDFRETTSGQTQPGNVVWTLVEAL